MGNIDSFVCRTCTESARHCHCSAYGRKPDWYDTTVKTADPDNDLDSLESAIDKEVDNIVNNDKPSYKNVGAYFMISVRLSIRLIWEVRATRLALLKALEERK